MSANDTVRLRSDDLGATPQARPDIGLSRILSEHIRTHGPLPVAQYMATCLLHPEYGYYMRKDPFGIQGDFITAPEISQIFGELIGIWMADQWMRHNSPKVTLMELGPGRGTLMSDLLRATGHVPRFHENLNIYMVEASPKLTQMQQKRLRNTKASMRWYTHIPDLPQRPLFVVANEFFDAMPVHQYVQTSTGLRERCVLSHNGEFEFVAGNPTPEITHDNALPEGAIIETMPDAEQIVTHLAKHIAEFGGCMLIADYGHDAPMPVGDTLQALRNHQFHHVLEEPGSADLTAHVNFRALREAVNMTEARVDGPIEQGSFLLRMGANTRASKLCEKATEEQKATIMAGLERLVAPDQMGSLFKVMAITPPSNIPPSGFA